MIWIRQEAICLPWQLHRCKLKTQMNRKRYRIAFSYAGEKREFVSKVAELLKKRFGPERLLYDKFHEAQFAIDGLGEKLPNLYSSESDLIVVFFCPNYLEKPWCGLEWSAIHKLIESNEENAVMLMRFNLVSPKGLSKPGFLDLDDRTPEQTTELILERLAMNENRPKQFYKKRKRILDRDSRALIMGDPPNLTHFHGRKTELDQIIKDLQDREMKWVAITAEGGSGKTSLAIRAAQLVPPPPFKVVLFVSAKQRMIDDAGVRSLSEFSLTGWPQMMNRIGALLGRVDIAECPPKTRADKLIDAFSKKGVLLILDNLESLSEDDQNSVTTFVEKLPDGCKAILTSRKRIGSVEKSITVEKLKQETAMELLKALATHNSLLAKLDNEQRLRLYEQTNGNPLLLRWTVGQLGKGSCRTINDALEFLGSDTTKNNPFEFIFGDLLQSFDKDELNVIAALTFPSHPIDVQAIAKICGIPSNKAKTALNLLINSSVVEPHCDVHEEKFSLIPMVAEFMRNRDRKRVDKIGLKLADRACEIITRNGYAHHDLFPILEEAWPTIAPAIPILRAGKNQRFQMVCSALGQFLDFSGRWDERLQLELAGEKVATMANDKLNAGWRACNAGWIYFARKDAKKMLECLDSAVANWKTTKAGRYEKSFTMRLRGAYHELMNENDKALKEFRMSLNIQRKLKPCSAEVARGLNDLATIEERLGNTNAAEQYRKKALEVARKTRFSEGVAAYTGLLSELALTQGKWSQAELLAREALAQSEKINRRILVARDYRRLAQALLEQERAVDASHFAEKAVAIFKHLHSPELSMADAILKQCKFRNRPTRSTKKTA